MGEPVRDGDDKVVALVGRAARLRRVLRLALEDAGYGVLERDALLLPRGRLAAVVVDLDSLGTRPAAVVAALTAQGLADTTPIVLISVYPPESRAPTHRGPLDYLQPPFAPSAIVERLGRAQRAPPEPPEAAAGLV
jgi:DNA-binding NtrC family response regulator